MVSMMILFRLFVFGFFMRFTNRYGFGFFTRSGIDKTGQEMP
jgi:hypothetical protein